MFDNIIAGKLFNSIIFYVIQLLFTYNSNSTKFFIFKKYFFNNLVCKLFNSIVFYVIQLLFTNNSNSTKLLFLNNIYLMI